MIIIIINIVIATTIIIIIFFICLIFFFKYGHFYSDLLISKCCTPRGVLIAAENKNDSTANETVNLQLETGCTGIFMAPKYIFFYGQEVHVYGQ